MGCVRGIVNNLSSLFLAAVVGSNTTRGCLFALFFDCILTHLKPSAVRQC
jgi:hypothetical protein